MDIYRKSTLKTTILSAVLVLPLAAPAADMFRQRAPGVAHPHARAHDPDAYGHGYRDHYQPYRHHRNTYPSHRQRHYGGYHRGRLELGYGHKGGGIHLRYGTRAPDHHSGRHYYPHYTPGYMQPGYGHYKSYGYRQPHYPPSHQPNHPPQAYPLYGSHEDAPAPHRYSEPQDYSGNTNRKRVGPAGERRRVD